MVSACHRMGVRQHGVPATGRHRSIVRLQGKEVPERRGKMNEACIMKTVAVRIDGGKETRYNFEPYSDDVTLEELKAIAKFLNEYIEAEEKGGAQ